MLATEKAALYYDTNTWTARTLDLPEPWLPEPPEDADADTP